MEGVMNRQEINKESKLLINSVKKLSIKNADDVERGKELLKRIVDLKKNIRSLFKPVLSAAYKEWQNILKQKDKIEYDIKNIESELKFKIESIETKKIKKPSKKK
jgi:hypothetical protein